MIDPDVHTIISGVMFGQEQVQVSFLDKQDQSAHGSIEQTLVVELSESDQALIIDIQEALIEIIDKYKTSLRQPPDTIERKNRFSRDEDDEDDD
jgi:hypothetical protein